MKKFVTMKLFIARRFGFLVFSVALLVGDVTWAVRPEGKLGGSQQLDIARLEKVLQKKFSTPFPVHRFDIDYFYKGDLARFEVGEEGVFVTCPHVVGPMVAFMVATGKDSDSFQPVADVSIDLDDAGKISRLYFFQSVKGLTPLPASHKVPVCGKDESAVDYLLRSELFWKEAMSNAPRPGMTKSQVEVAFRVATAALEEKK